MADIITTVPVPCDSKTCRYAFHLRHYWVNDDGTYSHCDSDGDHTECNLSDVPSGEKEDAMWLAYWQHVARTGDDCVGELQVPRDRRFQTWQAHVTDSVLGVIAQVRKGSRGPWLTAPEDFPQYVWDFLCVKPAQGGRLALVTAFPNVASLVTGAHDVRFQRGRRSPHEARFTFRVEVPRRPLSVRRIRTEARARIVSLSKGE